MVAARAVRKIMISPMIVIARIAVRGSSSGSFGQSRDQRHAELLDSRHHAAIEDLEALARPHLLADDEIAPTVSFRRSRARSPRTS